MDEQPRHEQHEDDPESPVDRSPFGEVEWVGHVEVLEAPGVVAERVPRAVEDPVQLWDKEEAEEPDEPVPGPEGEAGVAELLGNHAKSHTDRNRPQDRELAELRSHVTLLVGS